MEHSFSLRLHTTVFQAETLAKGLSNSIHKRATQVGTSIFFPTVSRQGPRQFPHKFQISLGLPSIPGKAHLA